uniref:ATG11 domain-containing protein n=1 Tax=Caenorhabditis japonica TaxID=281687 RepID=A0A8R1DE81_CAEJA
MYHIFYMDKGHCMMFNLNLATTTFHGLLDMVSAEVGHRVSDLIILDENGSAPDPKTLLCDFPTIGTSAAPVYLFLKSGTSGDGHLSSDVTYVFQMIDDAVDQAQYVLKTKDPLKVYMELPEKAKDCRSVCTQTLQTCATLVEQHRYLHKGWLALINNLDNSVSKMDKRGKRFKSTHQKIEELLDKSDALLLNYADVLEQLRRIEVPMGLLPKSAGLTTSTTAPSSEADEKCTLFEFIDRADPEHSLEELPELMQEKIRQLEEQNVKSVYSTLNSVYEQAQNQEFREFKGINKRFSQLEFSLKACEGRKDVIHKLVGNIVETPSNMDKSKLPSVVDDHRRYMDIIFENFQEFRNMVKVFDQSKQEILKNLRTRMAGFVVQSYDRLRTVHNDIVQYEFKGEAVRIHMDLIGQIRDAPILFSQSVSEVVRRRLLKEELNEWHLDHSNKSSQFSTDEEKSREQLSRKLRKHFLHVLFPGLFDNLPQFYVKSPLPKYDEDLPDIAKDYIKELRDAVPELEPYLKVTIPNVIKKLAAKGVRSHSTFGLTRHESFLTEEPMRMARSHFNYSPAAWLSEDGGDSSPIPQQLCRSPDHMMRESSCRSIPYVPSLQQLEGLDGPPGSSVSSSAPISIPHATSQRINFKQSGRQMSSQDIPVVGSAISSDTSLLGHETPVRDDTIMMIEKKEELAQKANMSSSVDSLDSLMDVYEKVDYSADHILVGLSDHTTQLEDAVKRLGIMQNFVSNLKPRNETIFKYLHQTVPRDFELIIHDGDKLKTRVKELGESVESLETELETRKMTESTLESKITELTTKHQKDIEDTQAECIKRLSVEFELMTDSMSRQNRELLESKDLEIEELKAKIEKMNAAHEKAFKNDPYTEEYKKSLSADIRAELEKEFKQRTEVITKAVEAKKDETFARQQKTLDIENRVLTSENEAKSKKLEMLHRENDQLASLIRQMPEGEIILEEFNTLKESQPTIQIKDRFAAFRSKMDKSKDEHYLDNDKIFLIDNILKVHKLQQLVNERQKYKDVIRNQVGGDQALLCLENKISAVAIDMETYWKELSTTNPGSDDCGRKVGKVQELQMEIVWLQSLVRSAPNGPSVGDISSALHQEHHQKDVETVTSIAMLDIFMDHDREEIKKLARAMQMWLNSCVSSLYSAGAYAVEDSPKVKECAGKYKSLAIKVPSTQMMEESFYQPMAASTIHVTTSPSDLAFEVERSSLNTISTQTRLCMPAMNLLVSVQDIKIGSAVLVIWHQVHNAYVIFCSSAHRFFVKESSIRRLGINTTDDATRRNWIIARVVRSESCSIKKPINRYNLPVSTIVRRVEVESVNMDFEGDFNEISIA